ncbi:MAG TPA: transposase [Armatimonadota bacterium]|nr:transposase [Armatimonadota bacterium]HOS42712.1 transposase [Armatimonadota bacterium]
MAGSFAALYYHLVFSTKDRRPQILPDFAPRLHEYLGGIIKAQDGIPVLIGGVVDHVHILAALSKNLSTADALRAIKANSSKWMHETFPHQPFAWQERYGAFSISVTGLASVKRYIANQEHHHRTVTFQEEFLHRHQIRYDPRSIWL